MKKRTVFFSAALIIISTAGFMFSTWYEVMLRSFGSETFSVEKWAEGNNQARAKMAYSFVTTYDIYSMKRKNIKEYLGSPNAYYNYDSFPAYALENNNKRYLIAFITDWNTGIVERYVVRSYPFSKKHKPQSN